ncbi:MAG: hypothetical protein OXE52_14275 [Chloroflexi bacterium]|nr:hypothetical protein [Chloroflexota bacterium]
MIEESIPLGEQRSDRGQGERGHGENETTRRFEEFANAQAERHDCTRQRLDELQTSIKAISHGLDAKFCELRAEFGELKLEFGNLRAEFGELKSEMEGKFAAQDKKLDQVLALLQNK